MQVEIRLYATLRRYAPQGADAGVFVTDLTDGASVQDLVHSLKIIPEEVHLIMVNGMNSTMERLLNSGDRIGLFPPIGGG